MDTRPTFGEIVKRRRLELGLTQSQLARRLGINQGSVAEFENKRDHEAKRSTLDRYARALESTAAELFGEAL